MKSFVAGFISAFALLVACAAAPIFPYKFYHIAGNDFAGTLRGANQNDDVPFERCRPVNGHQQCVVTFYSELTAMVKDYKQCQIELSSCQKECK